VEGICPTCEQPIPHDRFDEIKERIDARLREQAEAVSSRLHEQFAQEKLVIFEQAKQQTAAAREEERMLAIQQVTLARQEGRQAAEMAAQEKIAAANCNSEAAISALQARITETEAASARLQTQLEEVQRDSALTIEQVKQESSANEANIHAEAHRSAEAAVKDKMAGMQIARAQAEEKANAFEQQLNSANMTHMAQLEQALAEQREAMERDKVEAVNAEKSAAFEDKMKLSTKVEELQRAIDKKTAEELGEVAEIDLFEELKTEFEGDKIDRVGRGQPGADILHTVMYNGKECGKIIYDSKNHKGWRDDFVTKLSADKMAAQAEHAILSTHKFPRDTRQLDIRDGVILANPARVVALVKIVRQHLVQTHTLRLSDEARMQKTAQLYEFITSERCADFFARIDTHTEALLEIQVKEKKAHEATWRRQGELIRSVQKVRAELCREIDTIIGTEDATEASE